MRLSRTDWQAARSRRLRASDTIWRAMRENDGAYRDPLQGVRTRVRDLLRDVEEREARIEAALFEHLPRPLAEELRHGHARARLPLSTESDLREAEVHLASYRDALDRAIDLAPDIEHDRRALPDEAPEPELPRGLQPFHDLFISDIVLETAQSLESALRSATAAIGTDVHVETVGRFLYRARFRAHDVPFVLRAQVGYAERNAYVLVHVVIATSVAAGAAPMVLRPQTILHGIGKAIGLVREAEIGDDHFDELFLIEAEPEVAETLLGPAVRRAILEVARFDIPTLRVGEGRAEIRFCFEPNERALRGATLALSLLRGAPVHVALLRERA